MKKEIILTQECNREIRAISDTMEVLSGKWKIQIIATLLIHGKMRFMELKKTTNGIGAKKLSKDLEELEINKLITRTVMNTKPITVEYEITPYGGKMEPLINIITEWGIKHREHICKKNN
ncbi:winged helix-turn-helix transcriptional regulator [Flavobacterium sp. N502540]|uniref:winged helix-turn-helix transcriptional regulator n=1 Tax=Flavobacterium sp. N502540 TaxID=2986838 RepID=UPI0022241A15|nr:helix-turn-helix domain-containing protein [Flavobacterium sp. N502540]